jgi:hypothetical protein
MAPLVLLIAAFPIDLARARTPEASWSDPVAVHLKVFGAAEQTLEVLSQRADISLSGFPGSIRVIRFYKPDGGPSWVGPDLPAHCVVGAPLAEQKRTASKLVQASRQLRPDPACPGKWVEPSAPDPDPLTLAESKLSP